MSVLSVDKTELFNILQFINVVRVKYGHDNAWAIHPVLYTTEESMDILVDPNSNGSVDVGDKVVLKFQRQGFEYIVFGEIADVSSGNSSTATVGFSSAQKYFNLRKYMRFDIDLDVKVGVDGKTYKGRAKNISKGGAMISTDVDMEQNSTFDLCINLQKGEKFCAPSKVLRKLPCKDYRFCYGVQFGDTTEKNTKVLSKLVSKCEREYLKSLSTLREYIKKEDCAYATKIAIFSQDKDESYDIRESLVKLGAENFDVLTNFKYYINFLDEEKPGVVIIDTGSTSEEVFEMIDYIRQDTREIRLILVLPIEYAEKQGSLGDIADNHIVLYKPLIYNEFEESIIKYL